MNIPKRLLAKSSKNSDYPSEYESLTGHLLETTNIACHLVATRGKYFLKSLGLDVNPWLDRLLSATTRSAFIHDIGKANNHFQRMVVEHNMTYNQAFRHEIISLKLALTWSPLSQWLFEGCSDETKYAILFSVAGHHIKFKDSESRLYPKEGSGDDRLTIYTGHDDVKQILKCGKKFFNRNCDIFADTNIDLNLLDDPMIEVRRWVTNEANAWWEGINMETKKFVSLVKVLVIDSDIIASAVTKDRTNAIDWMDKTLGRVCSKDDLDQIVTTRLNCKSPRTFQQDVGNSSSRVVFVKAGCGSGKTVGAYLWATKKAQNKKLFGCYPTTGTATEGYKDYELAAKIDSRLMHSRAEVDIERLLESKEDKEGIDIMDYTIKYNSLEAYDVPIVVATADTVLGLIQNYRTGLYSFPLHRFVKSHWIYLPIY